jgi:hypothetical protein
VPLLVQARRRQSLAELTLLRLDKGHQCHQSGKAKAAEDRVGTSDQTPVGSMAISDMNGSGASGKVGYRATKQQCRHMHGTAGGKDGITQGMTTPAASC